METRKAQFIILFICVVWSALGWVDTRGDGYSMLIVYFPLIIGAIFIALFEYERGIV